MEKKDTSSSGSVLEEPEIQKLQITFTFQLSQHMNNLETLLNAETLHEMDSKSALSVIKVQFEMFINSDLLKPLDIYSRSLTLDTEENKTILKQLKKANASLTQELKECKTNLDETSRALGEATSSRDSCLIALQNKQTELEKYTTLNDRTSDYKILQTKLNETLYKRNQSIQTIHMLAPKCATYNGRSIFANPKYLKKAQSKKPRLYEIPYVVPFTE
ncbi:hypothetical protein Tco_0125123 [Tanacetum coccineum]